MGLKKLKDIESDEYIKWRKKCGPLGRSCESCILRNVNCLPDDANINQSAWIYHKEDYSEKFLNQELELDAIKLSSFETTFLSRIDKRYKYIIRGRNNILYILTTKPEKKQNLWIWHGTLSNYLCIDLVGEFDFIKFEDTEPYDIDKLLSYTVYRRS